MRRRVRTIGFHTLITALMCLWLQPPAAAQKRVALVIGIGGYQHSPKLSNPPRDAAAIADMFRKAGFEAVLARNDLTNIEFKRALREFLELAQGTDIAVLYFAGHGIQIGDQNYMVPVDARLAREYDAQDEAISLERIVEALEPAKQLRLVILDACRDNPFLVNMQRRVAMRSAPQRGLGRVEPTQVDTLIAYAARAGSTASDGDGLHSPFTQALIKHLTEPGLDVRLAFGRVRDAVLKTTNHGQEPFIFGSLGGSNIALVPASPTSVEERRPAPEAEAKQKAVEVRSPAVTEAKRKARLAATEKAEAAKRRGAQERRDVPTRQALLRPGALQYSFSIWPTGSIPSGQSRSQATQYGRLTCTGGDLGTHASRSCSWN